MMCVCVAAAAGVMGKVCVWGGVVCCIYSSKYNGASLDDRCCLTCADPGSGDGWAE